MAPDSDELKSLADTALAYGGQPAYERAKAAGKTRLTYAQWVEVRTPGFKRQFGDWEAIRHAAVLHGKAVATLRLEDAPKGGYADVEKWAAAIFAKQGGKAVSPEIGEVILDKRAAKNSLAHSGTRGPNAAKKTAFAAVKDVIEHGALVHRHPGKGEDSYYIAAPVVISGHDNIVTVLVHRDVNTHRMYLHSVILKRFLLEKAVSSADAEASKRSGGANSSPRGIRSVLHHILTINPATLSRPIDPGTGEPVL